MNIKMSRKHIILIINLFLWSMLIVVFIMGFSTRTPVDLLMVIVLLLFIRFNKNL